MKTLILFFAAIIYSSAVNATTPPRLALWITEPIGMSSGDSCQGAPTATGLPSIPYTLTEQDITGWNPDNGRWTLDSTRFPIDSAPKLQDRCFILAIDGKLISRGLMLSSYSARLTGLQTIGVAVRNNALELQITSGNHGRHSRVIHSEVIDAVLGQRANMQRQLQRVNDDPYKMGIIGNEWTAAIKRLIEENKIRQGMPIAELIKHLGPPSRVSGEGEIQDFQWYFNTRMHVNPLFMAGSDGGVVRAFSFGSR